MGIKHLEDYNVYMVKAKFRDGDGKGVVTLVMSPDLAGAAGAAGSYLKSAGHDAEVFSVDTFDLGDNSAVLVVE